MALSSIPSSSSSSSLRQIKHTVFLSFRGEDTRYNFTSHLHQALCDKQIETFIDDELNRGDEISQSLLEAIEESKISIIIFSTNYASSRWCLEELVKILECKEMYGQIVIPVFYNVCPSDVRNQTGTYGDAFIKHEESFKNSVDKMKKWKDALKKAADLSGRRSSNIAPESVLIKDIVEDILNRLNNMSPSDDSAFVGMTSRIKQIISFLCIGTEENCNVGIWGIGGIGKTTLAEAVFNKISYLFEGSYFSSSIREASEQSVGLNLLRQELLSTVLGDENMKNIGTSVVGRRLTRDRLGGKKLLIVFDDVSDSRQIESLIGSLDCLNSKSRIIITTRDRQVLVACRVKHIYEVKELPTCYALELFCKCAFKTEHPTVDYMDLSKMIAKYAGGVPLALKVLGSFLLGRGKQEWESAMSKFERIPNKNIYEVLKISYDGLDREKQKIFLDIACFFKGNNKDFVINTLNAFGFSAKIDVCDLIDKSLISISHDNTIIMHDLLQAMAKELVIRESIEYPGKRSRLWDHEDIYLVLTKNMGTEAVEGICLDMSKIKDLFLKPHAFVNMHRLRFLKFYNSSYEKNANKVHDFQALESDFAELRYLSWYKYPLKSLPSTFDLENLETLEMHYSNVEQLRNGVQHLVRLKEIDLSYSQHLTNWADFSSFPNLERLILKGCMHLLEIPSSIQCLSKLNLLNLTHCTRLTSLPDCSGLTSLSKLVLSYCSNLKMLSEMPCNIKELRLTGTAIEELPSSIENSSRLVILDLNHCSRLKSLPSSICKWTSLEYLCLSDCSKLDKLPEDIGTLKSLRRLRVERTGIREVPSSIIYLNNLYELSFRICKGLLLPPLLGLNNLGELDLTDSGITKLPDSVGCLSSLKLLNLGRNILENIPASIIDLSNIQSLDILFWKRPVEVIYIRERKSLKEILQRVAVLIGRRYFRCTNFFKLDRNILKDIVEDALPNILPKIQRLAALLKKKYCDKDFEEAEAQSTANICYPGSEIPKWFNYRSSGSFITVKLRPDWLNNNFVGFILCAVAAFPKSRTEYNLSIACQYKTSNGQVVSEVFIDTPYIDCPYNSKRVIIGFDSRFFHRHISESLSSSNEVSFRFFLKDDSNKYLKLPNTVEKCGVCLMYAQTHPGKSDGSFNTSEEEDETDLECLIPQRQKLCLRNRFSFRCYVEEDKTNPDGSGETYGDRCIIIFGNRCEVKVISEDNGLEWIIDPQTGQIISTNRSIMMR